MTEPTIPTPDFLRKLLRYIPETGKLYWLKRPPEMFKSQQSCGTWNTRYSGKEAFTAVKGDGYRHGAILGRHYPAHRVAFAIYHGEWPSDEVDHADRDRSNNKIDNLRKATASQNRRNRTPSLNGTSKFLGVHWCGRDKKWISRLNSGGGKTTCLGYFSCEIEAAKAYDAAASIAHGEFANLNFA